MQIVQEEAAFAGLREEWNDLAKASHSTIYQTWDWASAWWRAYARGTGCRLSIILFRDGGTLVAVCPLFVEPISLGGLVLGHETRFIGTVVSRTDSKGLFAWYSPTDYLDMIVLPGREDEVLSQLSQHLWSELSRGNRRISLSNLPEVSVLRNLLPRSLAPYPVTITSRVIETCPKVDLPATMEEFIARLKPSARRRWRKIKSSVEDTETFRIRSIQTPEAFDEAFRSLRSLHQSRWQKVGFPGVFFDKRYGLFLEHVCRDLLVAGHLWFKLLEYGGTIIAARLGLVFGNTMYDYLSGFDDDPSMSKFRPGLMLLYSMIRDSVGMNLRCVDLLRGNESYKSEVSSSVKCNSEITLVRSGLPHSMKRITLTTYLALRKLRLRVQHERILIQMQMKNAGFLRALVRYVAFRVGKSSLKLKRDREPDPSMT